MTTLMPRLPNAVADRLLDSFLRSTPSKWPGFDAENLPDGVRFAATGGSRVTSAQLRELRNGLLGIANRNGLALGASRASHAKFDQIASVWLAGIAWLQSGEALRDDVWAFISVVLAPDIVYWRFKDARERYLGGVRNTFQRLWMRAHALDRGANAPQRWNLLSELTEDALVQITERPSLGGNPMTARELGEAWVRAAGKYGRSSLEPIMRRVALRVRVLNEIRDLSLLRPDEVADLFDQMFAEAAEAISHKPEKVSADYEVGFS